MKRAVWVVAGALAVAGATWIVGWWAAAVVSVAAGWAIARDPIAPTLVGLSALLGWAGMLAVALVTGRLASVAAVMGGIFNRGPAPLVVLTLLIALLFGITGGEVGRWLRLYPSRGAAPGAPE